jgi:hypothetical protein
MPPKPEIAGGGLNEYQDVEDERTGMFYSAS